MKEKIYFTFAYEVLIAEVGLFVFGTTGLDGKTMIIGLLVACALSVKMLFRTFLESPFPARALTVILFTVQFLPGRTEAFFPFTVLLLTEFFED
ncbi:MAG: hypothetical protein LBN36_00970, partial [Clostridiales Family XIII bacterium]|nr:hypothetical protein [Clostridiales Family XIII bacterium]